MNVRIPDLEVEYTRHDVETYERGVRLANFAIWATLTSLSVVGSVTEQTDALASSMLAAAGTGLALVGEKIRHDRIKPYKEALRHSQP